MRWWPSRAGRRSSGLPGSPRRTTGRHIQACGRNPSRSWRASPPRPGDAADDLVILLPLLNPVENGGTRGDSGCHLAWPAHARRGHRLPRGGTRSGGAHAKDRVPKLEESLALMKQLWTGEEVTFAGQYAQVTKLRMGLTPVQNPIRPSSWGVRASAPRHGRRASPTACSSGHR